MPIKNAFEVLIKIFKSDGSQFVKGVADFDAIIDMRITPIPGGYETTAILSAEFKQLIAVLVTIA